MPWPASFPPVADESLGRPSVWYTPHFIRDQPQLNFHMARRRVELTVPRDRSAHDHLILSDWVLSEGEAALWWDASQQPGLPSLADLEPPGSDPLLVRVVRQGPLLSRHLRGAPEGT